MCVYIIMIFLDKCFINVWIYYMYMYVGRYYIGVRSDKILCFIWGK